MVKPPSLVDRFAAAQRAAALEDVDVLLQHALAALDCDSSDAIAWFNFANLLSEHRLYREAALLMCRCVRLQPMQPRVLQAFGALLVQSNQLEAAERILSLAVRLHPDLADAWSLRAQALARLLRFDAAIESYERCLQLQPLAATYLNDLAICLRVAGRLDQALTRYGQALVQRPGDSALLYNRGLTLLTRELSAEAWLAYEARFNVWEQEGRSRLQASPQGQRWNGAGPWPQQLLLVGEQGLGDVLQFVRYAPLLLERVARLQLCVPEKLIGLLRSSLPEAIELLAPEVLESQPAVPWLALMSLPSLLGITEANSVPQHPYLRVSIGRIEAWRARLRRECELMIGVHWQGNPMAETAYLQGRSMPLEQLAPLAALPGVRLLSLQRGSGAEQLAACSFRSAFVADQDELSALLDFEDTAAMVACCDVVVTSDSALAHLSAALGVPTHLLLHPFPDWRWGLDGANCHWYPSLRLYRQGLGESWRPVVLRLATELARQLLPEMAKGWWRAAVITMDAASERFAAFAEANAHLINRLEPWQAVDGRRFDRRQAEVSGLYSEAGLQVKGLTAGTIGCAASHRSLWESCLISNTPLLVLEDDVITHPGLELFIEAHRSELETCHVALFGCNTDSVLQARTAQGLTLTAVMEPTYPTQEWITAALAATDPEQVTFLALLKACGLCCYLITPCGAQVMLERSFPLTPLPTFMPLLRQSQLPGIALDWRLCALYPELDALICHPFLAYSPNSDSSTKKL
jgi:GR25 family glycosyltransferase involved in LPS biosynthesis/Flp pilus assembly protein TadD